jgi:hypothetical protein
VIALLLACKEPSTLVEDATPTIVSTVGCDACDGACVEEVLTYPARYHAVGEVDYVDLPPAGGPHDRCWTDWGVHDEPVPDDNFVHNLEHGGVVVLWNCPEGCDAEVAAIDAFVATHDRTVGTAYADMDARFAIAAWEARLTLDCFDPDAAHAYYLAHFDQAPESTGSPPPTSCSSGSDQGG